MYQHRLIRTNGIFTLGLDVSGGERAQYTEHAVKNNNKCGPIVLLHCFIRSWIFIFTSMSFSTSVLSHLSLLGELVLTTLSSSVRNFRISRPVMACLWVARMVLPFTQQIFMEPFAVSDLTSSLL